MLNGKISIEIVRSSEPGLSSISQRGAIQIYAALANHYTNVTITIVNNLVDLQALVGRKPELVFLGMKFLPKNFALGLADPDKIWVSEYLAECGIAYTGSSESAVALELNKTLAKRRVLDAGLKTPRFYTSNQKEPRINSDIDILFPVFVKPTSLGGGLGIDSGSVAYDDEQLLSKINSIAIDLRSDSLIEEYLPGREFSVAILKDEYSNNYSVMPIELIPPADEDGQRFLSRKVKKADTESTVYVEDGIIKSNVCELAISSFLALGARDYGRIDIRLDKDGEPHFLEANLIPGLKSTGSYFPKACLLNSGMDYEAVILTIVRLALIRKVEEYQNLSESIAINNIFEPFPAAALKPV